MVAVLPVGVQQGLVLRALEHWCEGGGVSVGGGVGGGVSVGEGGGVGERLGVRIPHAAGMGGLYTHTTHTHSHPITFTHTHT